MLLRRNRHVLFLCAALVISALTVIIYTTVEIKITRPSWIHHWTSRTWTLAHETPAQAANELASASQSSVLPETTSRSSSTDFTGPSNLVELATVDRLAEQHGGPQIEPTLTDSALTSHLEIFSRTTADGGYFPIKFGQKQALNPNIIPHPDKNDTWIIVAQQYKTPEENQAWFTQLVCESTFQDDSLQCLEPPMILPIASTSSPHCTGDLDYFEMNMGPHDARVFPGPLHPYIIYGSQSHHNCFGLWMQDFRRLVDWKHDAQPVTSFRHATNLQRPAPYAAVEKNWFVFWDSNQQMYAHYDICPQRAFAQLNWDGSVGEDIAQLARHTDSQCMEKYLGPGFAASENRYHQATNSLAVTMCRQNDPTCAENLENTFIMTIFQKKTYLELHSVYEPFVMLFKQTPPFEVHALSNKPLWIRGRKTAEEQEASSGSTVRVPPGQSEMIYVTSMAWKDSSRSYHGYLDDVIFLNFGIEDSQTGAIDVLASDLLAHVGLCDSF